MKKLKRLRWFGVALMWSAAHVVDAANWTTGWAKVLAIDTYAASGTGYVWLEATANNVNSCPLYSDSVSLGVPAVVFVYQFGNPMTDPQKSMIATLMLAYGTGRQVKIYSNGCSSYNTIDVVFAK